MPCIASMVTLEMFLLSGDGLLKRRSRMSTFEAAEHSGGRARLPWGCRARPRSAQLLRCSPVRRVYSTGIVRSPMVMLTISSTSRIWLEEVGLLNDGLAALLPGSVTAAQFLRGAVGEGHAEVTVAGTALGIGLEARGFGRAVHGIDRVGDVRAERGDGEFVHDGVVAVDGERLACGQIDGEVFVVDFEGHTPVAGGERLCGKVSPVRLLALGK